MGTSLNSVVLCVAVLQARLSTMKVLQVDMMTSGSIHIVSRAVTITLWARGRYGLMCVVQFHSVLLLAADTCLQQRLLARWLLYIWSCPGHTHLLISHCCAL
jgi:hypothetical protein